MKEACDQLLNEAQAGNPAALESLLAMHRREVFRYGLRYCKTSEDAEDAVQETLWAATKSIRAFRRAASITTWLFTIVRNKCHRKSRKVSHELDLADVLPQLADPTASIVDRIETEQVQRILARALASLEPTQREVILLRDVEGLTAPEAAQRLNLTVQALKSRLHRARASLRETVLANAQGHGESHSVNAFN
jgi:RNA polymerase sigma-70 factor, ECF subfamily